MKKGISLCIAILMILATLLILAACEDGSDPNPGGPIVNPGEIPEEERIPTGYLPETPYGTQEKPASFHILQWSVDGNNSAGQNWIPWEEGDVEGELGGLLEDAVYNRNALVEERYGVEITAEYVSVNAAVPLISVVANNNTSGDDAYQLMTTRAVELFQYVTNEYLLDMNTQSKYLHTDMPWWVQDSVISYTLGDHLYAACTEMLLRDKGATATWYFNQSMVTDYGLPDFFQLAREKKWTVEAMITAAASVSHSADNTDLVDSATDVWGMTTQDGITLYLYNAFGFKFAHINEDGLLETNFSAEDSIIALQDIIDDVMLADWNYNSETSEYDLGSGYPIFTKGNALFTPASLSAAVADFKSMKNLGILPCPLLNEFQTEYHSLVFQHGDSVLAIPSAAKDPEFCSVILEALSWESYYSVSPTFYDAILLARGAKDENSKEMIQIILDSRSYDPGQFWGNGSELPEAVLRDPLRDDEANISSLWASYGDAFQKELRRINNLITN